VTQAWTTPDSAKPRISAHHTSHAIWKALASPSPTVDRTEVMLPFYRQCVPADSGCRRVVTC
jgi:hypothetical protein